MEDQSNTPVIVITGASEGIGKAMAEAFAEGGARIGLIARRKELLEKLEDELRALGARDVRIAALDVTDFQAQRAALQEFEQVFNGITHLVLNAGISGRSHVEEDSWIEVKRCLDVNVMAALNAAEWMKPRMVARGSGTIAGVSSVAATRGLPESGAYSASKGALSNYLESLRVDLSPYGVRVVTIAPGFIRTALTGKNKGSMPFLMDVDRAGRIFARAVLKGESFSVAPWQFRWVIRLLKLLPNWLFDPMARLFMGSVRHKK